MTYFPIQPQVSVRVSGIQDCELADAIERMTVAVVAIGTAAAADIAEAFGKTGRKVRVEIEEAKGRAQESKAM